MRIRELLRGNAADEGLTRWPASCARSRHCAASPRGGRPARPCARTRARRRRSRAARSATRAGRSGSPPAGSSTSTSPFSRPAASSTTPDSSRRRLRLLDGPAGRAVQPVRRGLRRRVPGHRPVAGAAAARAWPATAGCSSPSVTPTSRSTASAAPSSPTSPSSAPASRAGTARLRRVLSLQVCRRMGPELLAVSRELARRIPLGALTRERKQHRGLSAPGARASATPEIRLFPTVADEVVAIADLLRRAHLVDGLAWDQMAVLVRSGVRSIPVVRRALVAAGVPVAVAADEIPLAHGPGGRAVARRVARRRARLGRTDPGAGPVAAAVAARRATPTVLRAAGPAAARTRPRRRRRHSAAVRRAAARRHRRARRPVHARGLGGRAGSAARARCSSEARRARRRAGDARRGAVVAVGRLGLVASAGVGRAPVTARRRVRPTATWTRSSRCSRPRHGWRTAGRAPGSRRCSRRSRRRRSGGTDGGARLGARRGPAAHGAPSKGLEWDLVVVAGVQDGVWPDLRRRGSLLDADSVDRRRAAAGAVDRHAAGGGAPAVLRRADPGAAASGRHRGQRCRRRVRAAVALPRRARSSDTVGGPRQRRPAGIRLARRAAASCARRRSEHACTP